jgi:hypothetical protein
VCERAGEEFGGGFWVRSACWSPLQDHCQEAQHLSLRIGLPVEDQAAWLTAYEIYGRAGRLVPLRSIRQLRPGAGAGLPTRPGALSSGFGQAKNTGYMSPQEHQESYADGWRKRSFVSTRMGIPQSDLFAWLIAMKWHGQRCARTDREEVVRQLSIMPSSNTPWQQQRRATSLRSAVQ